jgi:hypothetical protein
MGKNCKRNEESEHHLGVEYEASKNLETTAGSYRKEDLQQSPI